MKRKLLVLALAVVAAGASLCNAQGRTGSLFINEVMVQNDSNLVDDFGQRSGWIELYNAKFAPLEISSVYITNDRNNPTKYAIPLGDINTKIPKRQHVVFFADNMPSRGTFHTSFKLEPGKDNWIGLYDSDKQTLIDSVLIPASLPAGASYARTAAAAGSWSVRTDSGADGDYITPSSSNIIRDTNPKIETFAQRDSNGFAMTIMAMCVVFSALALLCICFMAISALNQRAARKKAEAEAAAAEETEAVNTPALGKDANEEIAAAIAMALHDHFDAHDRESAVLTINKVKRAYSPWSSKIYNMRQTPHK